MTRNAWAARGSAGNFSPRSGVAPALGRVLTADDDQAGHDHVVVLSDGLWKRLFGAKPDIVGHPVSLNGEAYQVVGVMPRGFVDPWNPPTEIWSPVAIDPARFTDQQLHQRVPQPHCAREAGLQHGCRDSRDDRRLPSSSRRTIPTSSRSDWTLEVKSMTEVQTGAVRPALLLLLGAVGFVLLIACANVANLLLARAASRQREVAIRTALGAKPWDLIRQLLVESLMLSLSGGALGLAIAYGSIKALAAANPSRLPRVQDLAIDAHVVLFTLAIAVVTGIVFGLVPALQAWKGNLQVSLKDGSRTGTADKRGQLARRVLVVAEIALALTLLTGGGLLLKSFARLVERQSGVRAARRPHLRPRASAARIRDGHLDARRSGRRSCPRIAQVPGVRGGRGPRRCIPFGGGWSTGSFNVEGYTPPPKANGPWGDIRIVTPDFFNTMRIPRLKGRVFGTHDDAARDAGRRGR